MSIKVESPPNYLPRIDQVWMVLSVDEGGEGVVAAPLPGHPDALSVPLIAADETRLKTFIIPMAMMMSQLMKRKMRLVKFSTREVLKEFGGE